MWNANRIVIILRNPNPKNPMNIKLTIPMVGFGLVLTCMGDNIVPVAWKQSNALGDLRTASFLSNGTGMNPEQTILYNLNASLAGEPNTANSISWATTSKTTAPATIAQEVAAGKVWIVADLGGITNLSSLQLWNFQWAHSSGNLANRGINQFDVLIRNSDLDTATGLTGSANINVGGVSDLAGAISNSTVFNLGTSNPWTMALENQTLTVAPNNDTYTGQNFTFPANTQARFIAIRVDTFYGGAGVGLGKVRIDGTLLADTSAPIMRLIRI
jgi:hypothetical protein